MTGPQPSALGRAIVFVLTVGTAGLVPAQPAGDATHEGLPVRHIRFVGLQNTTRAYVQGLIQTREDKPLSLAQLERDVRALIRTGRFVNAFAEHKLEAGELVVIFHVQEKPYLQSIDFVGHRKYKTSALLKELPFREGDPIDEVLIRQGREAIESKYKDAGYFYVNVTYDADLLARDQRLVYEIVEGPRVKVRKILFEGNRSFSDATLRRQVSTDTYLWLFRTGAFDPQQAQQDAEELRRFYREHGYLDARVSYEQRMQPDGEALHLRFLIDEGTRYDVKSIAVEGNEALSDETLRGLLRSEAGRGLRLDVVHEDARRLEAAYGQQGYIDAKVEPRWVFDSQPGLVQLTYQIAEGPFVRFGQAVIRGNKQTQDKVIRRQLGFYPEQPYDLSATRRAEQRLLETRLFSKASITPVPAGPGVRDALVEVEEAETTTFLMGLGVSSDSGVLGSISLENRNFDLFDPPRIAGEFFRGRSFKGAGQYFRIQIEPGTELTRFRIDFREPFLLDQPISLGTSAYLYERGRDGYDERRLGGIVSFGRRFDDRILGGLLKGWAGEVALRLEYVDIRGVAGGLARLWEAQDILDAEGDHYLSSVKGTLLHDTTDSLFLPSRGHRLKLSYEQAGALGGDYTFGKALADVNWYYTVYTDSFDRKHILAVRGTMGYIVGDSPVFERFYGGGMSTLRGFDFRGVSPRQGAEDRAVGGDFLLLTGAEYGVPLYGKTLRGVVFTDMGTVEEDFEITSWRVTLGLGLRVIIPYFGPVPLAFDFAWPVAKDGDDDTQVFSFSIGATF